MQHAGIASPQQPAAADDNSYTTVRTYYLTDVSSVGAPLSAGLSRRADVPRIVFPGIRVGQRGPGTARGLQYVALRV